MQWNDVIIALIGAGIGQILIAISTRKKTVAETTDIITKAAGELAKSLNDQLTLLNGVVQEQRNEIQKLSQQIATLRQEVLRLGGNPDQLLNVSDLTRDHSTPYPTKAG